MKISFSKFKYPKILLLIISITVAYFLFSNEDFIQIIYSFKDFYYLSIFLAGILFAFGFTAPFSAGFFINLNPQNILIVGVIGGLGALIGDLLIFSFIRFSFKDEFKKLRNTAILRKIEDLINKSLGEKIKLYLMYSFAGILIASPLPDEFGITFLAGLTKVKLKTLIWISFILNTSGILILLAM